MKTSERTLAGSSALLRVSVWLLSHVDCALSLCALLAYSSAVLSEAPSSPPHFPYLYLPGQVKYIPAARLRSRSIPPVYIHLFTFLFIQTSSINHGGQKATSESSIYLTVSRGRRRQEAKAQIRSSSAVRERVAGRRSQGWLVCQEVRTPLNRSPRLVAEAAVSCTTPKHHSSVSPASFETRPGSTHSVATDSQAVDFTTAHLISEARLILSQETTSPYCKHAARSTQRPLFSHSS
jgi:hypothetical protein